MLYTTDNSIVFFVNGEGVERAQIPVINTEARIFQVNDGMKKINLLYEPDVVTWKSEPLTTRHKLSGNVSVEGHPASKMVIVINRVTFKFVAATTSDPTTGDWVIQGIEEYPMRSLMVFAIDDNEEYNTQVFDYISQCATV